MRTLTNKIILYSGFFLCFTACSKLRPSMGENDCTYNPKLKALSCEKNVKDFANFPKDSIENLFLTRNNTLRIPQDISSLSNVHSIFLSASRLIFPADIKIKSLKSLVVYSDFLETLPRFFLENRHIKHLLIHISHQKVVEELAVNIDKLQSLIVFTTLNNISLDHFKKNHCLESLTVTIRTDDKIKTITGNLPQSIKYLELNVDLTHHLNLVKNCPNIRHLTVESFTSIQEDYSYLSNFPQLEDLYLTNTKLNGKEQLKLREKLKKTHPKLNIRFNERIPSSISNKYLVDYNGYTNCR